MFPQPLGKTHHDEHILRTTEVARKADAPGRDDLSACLVRIHPTETGVGGFFALTGHAITLGRGKDCDICIDDGCVSRLHARIVGSQEGYHVVDLRSTNGTHVNEHSVFLRKLNDGDYLRVGRHIFRFLSGDNLEVSYHREIQRLVTIDALTEISNQRYLLEFLDRELSRAQRYQRPLAVVMFDIDHFKDINDDMGHLAGDFTLRELVTRLRGTIRTEDLLARYGGDEFAAVLTESGEEEAAATAERLRSNVELRPFDYEGRQYAVTISVGIGATIAGEEIIALDLIRRADAKLYAAKHEGRNRVAV